MSIDIEYCNKCGYLKQYEELAKYISENHPDIKINGHEGRRGSFEILINGELVHSKLSTLAYPDYEDLSTLVKDAEVGKPLRTCKQQPITKKKKIIIPSQHGFQKNKSTISAMIEVIETIIENFEDKQDTEVACLDRSKAFDCVNHQILLDKLYFYGIRGPAHNILSSYLRNRRQVVSAASEAYPDEPPLQVAEWKDIQTNEEQINMGVPQGSILGPILFILYTNDLTANVNTSKSCIDADDNTFLNSSNNTKSLKQKSTEAISMHKIGLRQTD
ncbi:unnamed protein product [Brassicogethes aeneus]|uniref:Migration and invasion enhancer 1 n=1 Tax=Brassicogethes aeneus TaxID=1431903 RepID=A0A9P0BAY9_BRAAE|nr:unnamed protein product [Brassicogethes aeneus]